MRQSATFSAVYTKHPSPSHQGTMPDIGLHLKRPDSNIITLLAERGGAYGSAIAMEEQRAYNAHIARFPELSKGYQPIKTYSADVIPILDHPRFKQVRDPLNINSKAKGEPYNVYTYSRNYSQQRKLSRKVELYGSTALTKVVTSIEYAKKLGLEGNRVSEVDKLPYFMRDLMSPQSYATSANDNRARKKKEPGNTLDDLVVELAA